MLTLIYSAFVDKVVMPAFKMPEQDGVYDAAKAGLAPIVERLERQNFICGDKVTLPDFQLFEAINYLTALGAAKGMENSRAFVDYPYLQAYQKRMSELPGLKQHLASDRHAHHCFYPPFAKCQLKMANGEPENPPQ